MEIALVNWFPDILRLSLEFQENDGNIPISLHLAVVSLQRQYFAEFFLSGMNPIIIRLESFGKCSSAPAICRNFADQHLMSREIPGNPEE